MASDFLSHLRLPHERGWGWAAAAARGGVSETHRSQSPCRRALRRLCQGRA